VTGDETELYRDPTGSPGVVWTPPSLTLDESAQAPDVSRLPGASIVAAVAFGDRATLRVRAGCARGPSGRFAKGIEDVLLDRATWFALASETLTPSEMAIVEVRGTIDDGLIEEQRDGKVAAVAASPDGSDRAVAMRHLLTFAGKDRDILLCSVMCVGPDKAGQCHDVTRSLRLVGTHAPPPPPSLLTHAVFFAADHPVLSLGLVVLAFVLVSGVILWRRPRSLRRFG